MARSAASVWRSRLAVLAGGVGRRGIHGQGIYPGNPAPDAFRLPYDFEPVIRLRTFYKNTDTLTGTEQEAWVLGGFAGLRSPWFGDLFQFGVVGYTSQKLYGPAGKGGTLLLQSDQSSIYRPGRSVGRGAIAGQTIAGYRQLIDRPFINPQDTRELPNTFEAYTLTGAYGRAVLHRRLHDEDEDARVGRLRLGVEGRRRQGPARRRDLRGRDVRVRRNRLRQGRRGVLDRRVQHVLHRRPVSDRPSTTRRG